MGTKSILKRALAAEKGVNILKLMDKKRQKEARKHKTKQNAEAPAEDDAWEDEPAAPVDVLSFQVADDAEAEEDEYRTGTNGVCAGSV
jgi:hypothetical protein